MPGNKISGFILPFPWSLVPSFYSASRRLSANGDVWQNYAIGQKFTIAAMSYLTVVYSVLFGHFRFGETLSGQEIAGIAVIIGAGLLSIGPKNAGGTRPSASQS